MRVVQDTALAGSPPSIAEIASYLRAGLGSASESFGSDIASRRSSAATAWQGKAAEAFSASLSDTITTSDDLSCLAATFASAADTLSRELAAAQDLLAQARDIARAAGLSVTGTEIHHPGSAPPAVGSLSAEADVLECRAHQTAITAFNVHETKTEAWNTAVWQAAQAYRNWQKALDDFAATWDANSTNIIGMTSGVFGGAANSINLGNQVYQLISVKNLNQNWLNSALVSLDAAADPHTGEVLVGRGRYYQILDQISQNRAAIASADDALHGSTPLQVSSALGRGLFFLGVAATGYGIFDDIHHGESTEQAVVSNTGGFVASLAAGTATGMIVGSFIVPPAGTIVGAALGAVVGAGVGIFTSGAIDHLYENASAGFVDTCEAGWNELVGTGDAINDLAKDAWSALF